MNNLPSEEEIAELIEVARCDYNRHGPAQSLDQLWSRKAARAVLAIMPGSEPSPDIEEWIKREFAGHGVAIRRKDEAVIPGEPFMSMEVAKDLARRAFALSSPDVSRVQEALEPFAKMADAFEAKAKHLLVDLDIRDLSDEADVAVDIAVRLGDCRRARSALNPTGDEK